MQALADSNPASSAVEDEVMEEGGVVTMNLLAQARAGDADAFGQLIDPYKREWQVHCCSPKFGRERQAWPARGA